MGRGSYAPVPSRVVASARSRDTARRDRAFGDHCFGAVAIGNCVLSAVWRRHTAGSQLLPAMPGRSAGPWPSRSDRTTGSTISMWRAGLPAKDLRRAVPGRDHAAVRASHHSIGKYHSSSRPCIGRSSRTKPRSAPSFSGQQGYTAVRGALSGAGLPFNTASRGYRRLGMEARTSIRNHCLRSRAPPDHRSSSRPRGRDRGSLAHRPANHPGHLA